MRVVLRKARWQHKTRIWKYVVKICKNENSIESRFPNETMSFGPQTFIVKSLIISNTDNHPIYIKIERREKGLAARETERESVCERRRVAEKWR